MTGGLEWKPAAGPEALRLRADTLARIRVFFQKRGVMEVSTPVLTTSGVTDPHIESLAVDGPRGLYLRTSPEYFHKRLLAAGCKDLYEIGPVFRGGDDGPVHTREFILLEWYRVDWTWQALAEEVVELVYHALPGRFDDWPVIRRRWSEIAADTLGVDPLGLDDAALASLTAGAPAGLDRSGLLDWLFATRIQPDLDGQTISVICDFPVEHAALARIRPDPFPVAERFEVFLGALELANGYQELTDSTEQLHRLESDNRQRKALGLPAMPVDRNLLGALDAGLPECAGVALGVDRLLMAAFGESDIRNVQAF